VILPYLIHNLKLLSKYFNKIFKVLGPKKPNCLIMYVPRIFKSCLTETWLNDTCFDHKLFPHSFTIFRSDRVSSTKSRGGGVLITVWSRVHTFKHRYDLQFYEKCARVKIYIQHGHSLLTGNHYLPPDTKSDVISNCFFFGEKPLYQKSQCSLN
jgi:hypothetical protein